IAVFESNPTVALVYGRTLIWYSWSLAATVQDFYYPLGVLPNNSYEPPAIFELLLENKAQSPTTCNALMRVELINWVGGFEEKFRGMFEDLTFFARALAVAPVYVSDQLWAKYRQHDESCSAISASAGLDDRARYHFLLWLHGALAGRGSSWRIW